MAQEEAQAKISAEIIADARAKVDRAVKAAAREQNKIIGAAREEAKQAEESIIEKARQRAESRARIIRASAEPARRRLQLDAQEAVVLGVINDAKARLLDRDSDGYAQLLAALAAEAAELLGGDRLTAYLSEQDYAQLGADIARRFEAAAKAAAKAAPGATFQVLPSPRPIAGGVIVASADGSRQVDNSIEARLRRIYPEIRRKIARALFGDAADENRKIRGKKT